MSKIKPKWVVARFENRRITFIQSTNGGRIIDVDNIYDAQICYDVHLAEYFLKSCGWSSNKCVTYRVIPI